jgi:UDPglucose 6-dehydrogenase
VDPGISSAGEESPDMTEQRNGIGVFGAGYVGLVTAACFAELGRDVTVYDVDPGRIATLGAGRVPIHEPGLPELIARNVAANHLRFTTDPAGAVAGKSVVFIAVGTPPGPDGRADLGSVRAAAATIAEHLDGPTVVVNKSTVPVETGDLVDAIVRGVRRQRHDIAVISNPEFLREGSAIADFMHPDRIVVGCSDPAAEGVMRNLYASFGAPLIITDVHTAEMIKYAANAFLATKISFINEIALICERVGADVTTVAAGIGADARIGPGFLRAGLGFGGSCLPKDVNALRRVAEGTAVEPLLLDAVFAVNTRQIERIAARTAYLLGGLTRQTVAVLGLAFKPQTDDVRESPALTLVEAFLASGARVHVHDPVAAANARVQLGERVTYATDPLAAALSADALVLATEWPQYRDLDPALLAGAMRRRIVVDARNFLDGERYVRAGFSYTAVGRPTHAAHRMGEGA